MTKTTLSRRGNNYRATLPRALADAIAMAERENRHVACGIRWTDAGLTVEMTLSPDLASGMNVMQVLTYSSGQTFIEFPGFQVTAWGIDGAALVWPDPEEVAAAPDEPVTIQATVPDWEPPVDADLFAASAGVSYRSAITKSGDERTNIETSIPITLAEGVGLTAEGVRAQVTFDFVDGRKVMVVEPIAVERSEATNSVAVHLAGAKGRQARINAGRIAAEFGVLEALDERSVPLRWGQQDGQLLAFKAEGSQ